MNDDLIAHAEAAQNDPEYWLPPEYAELVAEVRRKRAAVQRVMEVVNKQIGAPCDCNAIAYQIIRALDGEES